jgi:predicted AAA+ superfamily ATPase
MIPKIEIPRILNPDNLLKKKSFFLFGARGTGKTSLIRATLPHCPRYDLLSASTFGALARRPSLIGEENWNPDLPVVIDEIQKLPQLLDEVHRLIEERNHGRRAFFLSSQKSSVNLISIGISPLEDSQESGSRKIRGKIFEPT